jgi:hypothetical protein
MSDAVMKLPRPQVPEGRKKHDKQTKRTPTIQRFEHFRKRFLEDSVDTWPSWH